MIAIVTTILGAAFLVLFIRKLRAGDRRLREHSQRLWSEYQDDLQEQDRQEQWRQTQEQWAQYDSELHGDLQMDSDEPEPFIAVPGAPTTARSQSVPALRERVRLDDAETATVWQVKHGPLGTRVFVVLDRIGLTGYLDIPHSFSEPEDKAASTPAVTASVAPKAQAHAAISSIRFGHLRAGVQDGVITND